MSRPGNEVDWGKIKSDNFLKNLQIFFHGSPDFPLPGVGGSGPERSFLWQKHRRYALPTSQIAEKLYRKCSRHP